MIRSAAKIKRRTQEERSAATRRQLLAATVNCIAERGLAGATLPDIVERAGVTTGAVQHHFGSREDLLIAVVDDFADKISQRGRPTGLEMLAMRDRISVICHELWEAFGSAEYIAVTEILLGLRSRRDLFQKIQPLMRTAERELDQYWMHAFEKSGIAKSDLAVARHLFQACLRGLALRGAYKSHPESWIAERRLLEELIGIFLGARDRGSI